MKTFHRPTLLAALFVLYSSVALASSTTSNKWRLSFSGNAESAGTIVLQLSPEGGETVDVSVDIEKGRSENHVAKDVVTKLKAEVGETWHVERDDGEDVLIKKHHGDANFGVLIVSNSVEGVRIKQKKE